MGSQRIRHNWVTNTFTFFSVLSRGEMQAARLRFKMACGGWPPCSDHLLQPQAQNLWCRNDCSGAMSGCGLVTHNSSLSPVLGPLVSVLSSHLLFGSIKMLLIPRTSFAWYPAFSLGVCILVSHSSLGWREGAEKRTLRVVFRVDSGKDGKARPR